MCRGPLIRGRVLRGCPQAFSRALDWVGQTGQSEGHECTDY